MNKIRTLAAVAAIGLSTLFTSRVEAQPLTVNVKLTVYTEKDNTNGSSAIIKKTVVTKDLLELIGDIYSTNFPSGAKLVLINFNTFQVRDAQGNVILSNISSYLSFAYSLDYLTAEKNYSGNQAGSSSYVYISTITFDDGSNNFVFRGFTTEKYSQSAKNSQGHQTYKDSIIVKGSGDGNISGEKVFINGQFVGKGTVTN